MGGSKWILEKAKQSHRRLKGLHNKVPVGVVARLFINRPHSPPLSSVCIPMEGKSMSPLNKWTAFLWILSEICPHPIASPIGFSNLGQVLGQLLHRWPIRGRCPSDVSEQKPYMSPHLCSLPYMIILFSYVCIFPLDKFTEVLHGKSLSSHSEAQVPT